jgi:dihydrolipoamide dehydrogenase
MLVLGGGIIGLEMACVYDALGSKVTVVELMDQIMPGADKDIVKPLHKRIEGRYEAIHAEDQGHGGRGDEEGPQGHLRGTRTAPEPTTCSTRCWSRWAAPQRQAIGAERRASRSTSAASSPSTASSAPGVPHIFAIGDVVGQPMLAHKAVHEGKVAAEVCRRPQARLRRPGDPVGGLYRPRGGLGGVTENEAKAQGIKYGKGVFPWAASGRSLALAATRA